MGTLEKLELKLNNMAYFIMKLKDATVEEKLKIFDAMEVFRNVVETIKKGKEVGGEVG